MTTIDTDTSPPPQGRKETGKKRKQKPKQAPLRGLVAFRLNQVDQEALEKQAAARGKTLSGYARERLTGIIETSDRQPIPVDRQYVYGVTAALRRTVEEMRIAYRHMEQIVGRSDPIQPREDNRIEDIRHRLGGLAMALNQFEADVQLLQYASYEEAGWRWQ